MGHKQDGLRLFAPDTKNLKRQVLAGQRIEGPERLVHQQNVGPMGERSGDPGALLHSPGEFARMFSRELLETDEIEQAIGALDELGRAAVHHACGEKYVVEDCGPGQQGRRLEHDACVGPRRRNRNALDRHAPGIRRDQTCHHPQQGGFATTRRSDQAGETVTIDGKRHVLQRHDIGAIAEAEALSNTLEDNHLTAPVYLGRIDGANAL